MENHAQASAGPELHAPARSLARLAALLRANYRLVFWIAVLGAAGCVALVAARRPLWFDEIFTWQIATRPNVRELVAALGPMDPSPPLHYLLVRGSHALFGTSELATRLPALLSFVVALVALHRLVLPLAGPIFALALVAALLLTPAVSFAAEARPYAFLLACCAMSLLAWREVASGGRRRLGLAVLLLSLTAALYAHFYAFLLFVPIVAGEAVRSVSRKRLDLAVWIDLACAAILALPLLPLLQSCWTVRSNFWAAPSWLRLGQGLRLFTSLALVAALGAMLGIVARYRARGVAAEPAPRKAPAHEIAAAAGLAALPLVAFLAALWITNAYDPRYVLPSLLGVLLLLAHGTRFLRQRRTDVATALLAAVCLLVTVHAVRHTRRALLELPRTVPLPLPDDGPRMVAVADPFAFVQTVQAAAPETRDRLVYLIDARAQDYRGNTPEVSVLGLGKLLPLHIEDYQTFVVENERFWLFDETGRWGARLRSQQAAGGHDLAVTARGLQLWTR